MNRDVIIIGCGFIGKIKARVWCELGFNVYVHDIDEEKEANLLKTDTRIRSFRSHPESIGDAIVDISTPNSRHGDALVWALEHIASPRAVLIEKPICSNDQERQIIEGALATKSGLSVYVGETYYWSEALAWLAQRLQEQGETPTLISINLSKNRLVDVYEGRFFDKELQSYGIEIPHAVAILQILGVDVFDAKVSQNVQYLHDSKEADANQGVHIELVSSRGTIVHLNSFLGDFYIEKGKKSANETRRTVVVDTLSDRYTIDFDPVAGANRYTSRVTIESTGETMLMEDNHLKSHMQHVDSNNISDKMAALLSVNNALDIYKFLSSLSQTARTIRPSGVEASFLTGRQKDKENVI